jgi:hypothetical protein
VVKPAPVAPGQTATVSTKVQARVAGTVAVEATARNAQEQAVWKKTWPTETFSRWQSRSYNATWAVPATQPGGAYTLTVRVTSGGAAVATPREVTFQVVATGDGAEPSTPNSPAPPAPTPTPAPITSGSVAITGSATFVNAIRSSLDYMKAHSPSHYAIVATYVSEVRESGRNYSTGGSRVVEISSGAVSQSITYRGSLVLHEADHVRNWFTGNFPVFGCDGEAKTLRVQASYLYAVGDTALAQWIESLIGTWC